MLEKELTFELLGAVVVPAPVAAPDADVCCVVHAQDICFPHFLKDMKAKTKIAPKISNVRIDIPDVAMGVFAVITCPCGET